MPRRHPKQTDLLAWKGYFDQTNSYAFSTEDFAQSELLAFSLYPGYEDFYVLDQAGMPCVLLERFKDYDYDNSCDYEEESNIFLNGHIHFFRLPDNQLIVSVEGGNLLKQSGLTGFSITRSLRVIGDGADRVKDVYWHVDLPLVLPLSTQTHWERPEGQLYTGFWEPGAELADGEQFLFDRSTVQAAGPFDLAMWKGYQTWPGMIGSHRWFEFCEANKIRCDWRPVRVVD